MTETVAAVPAPAGFWRRFLAHMIDGIILAIPGVIINFAVHANTTSTTISTFTQIAWWGVDIAYSVLFITGRWQATPGKRVMGVYLVRAETHQRVSKPRATARYLIVQLPLIPLLVAPFFVTLPQPAAYSDADKVQLNAITEKNIKLQPLTQEERNFLTAKTSPVTLSELTPDDKRRYEVVLVKVEHSQKLNRQEQDFYETTNARSLTKTFLSGPMLLLQLINVLASIYWLVLAITIGCSREKAGFHDKICKTRALKGRL